MDIKYIIIRFFQTLVLTSNKIQKTLIKDKKIKLKGDEKILILKGDRIGDAVWSIYMCETLKANFPDIKISVLSNEYNKFIFEENKKLFEKIYSIDENPPHYLIKDIYKIFNIILNPFLILFKNKKTWIQLKKEKFDYVMNLTGRDYSLTSIYLGNSIGYGLGIFNWIYKYPMLGHTEIGATKHVGLKWLSMFQNIKIKPLKSINNNSNKILLFLGGKHPNKLEPKIYSKLKKLFSNKGFEVKTLSDNKNEKADFYLSKDNESFKVGEKKLKTFLEDFGLFIGIDGGVLHYCARHINTLSFCIASNFKAVHPFGKSLYITFDKNGRKLFNVDNIHYIISKGAKCQGCFLIGCDKMRCAKSLDIEIEIIINDFIETMKK